MSYEAAEEILKDLAGIVHQFNNKMAIITGACDYVYLSDELDGECKNMLKDARNTCLSLSQQMQLLMDRVQNHLHQKKYEEELKNGERNQMRSTESPLGKENPKRDHQDADSKMGNLPPSI